MNKIAYPIPHSWGSSHLCDVNNESNTVAGLGGVFGVPWNPLYSLLLYKTIAYHDMMFWYLHAVQLIYEPNSQTEEELVEGPKLGK